MLDRICTTVTLTASAAGSTPVDDAAAAAAADTCRIIVHTAENLLAGVSSVSASVCVLSSSFPSEVPAGSLSPPPPLLSSLSRSHVAVPNLVSVISISGGISGGATEAIDDHLDHNNDDHDDDCDDESFCETLLLKIDAMFQGAREQQQQLTACADLIRSSIENCLLFTATPTATADIRSRVAFSGRISSNRNINSSLCLALLQTCETFSKIFVENKKSKMLFNCIIAAVGADLVSIFRSGGVDASGRQVVSVSPIRTQNLDQLALFSPEVFFFCSDAFVADHNLDDAKYILLKAIETHPSCRVRALLAVAKIDPATEMCVSAYSDSCKQILCPPIDVNATASFQSSRFSRCDSLVMQHGEALVVHVTRNAAPAAIRRPDDTRKSILQALFFDPSNHKLWSLLSS